MTAQEKRYWISFSAFNKIGPKKFQTILKYFGSAEKAWNAEKGDWGELPFGRAQGKGEFESFSEFRETFDFSSYNLRLEKEEINSITLEDNNYPKSLKEIDSAPFVIYILGEIIPEDELAIGIVGTRKITSYGQQVTQSLTFDLAVNGLTIVSGLAYGVDNVAHETALEAKGRTIGVWAGGLDTAREGYRQKLIQTIIENKQGAIISEYPLGSPPLKTTFPQRNRIISGLSLGVLVTEAAEDSGSLITAEYAVKQGRKVFAVPGPITSSLSAGTAKLLKEKATLVYSVKDILDELSLDATRKAQNAKRIFPENPDEKKIMEILENENHGIDEIAKLTRIDISKLSGILTMMEMKGMIKSLGGTEYRRI